MDRPKDALTDLKTSISGAATQDAKIEAILKYLGAK